MTRPAALTPHPAQPEVWGPPDPPLELIARNVSTRYLAILIEGALGLVMLPFNVAHLGPSAYGLWTLMTSITWFFGVLDLGYGGAMVKFIAQYRAWRDRSALNEILSTIGVIFAGLGVVCMGVTALLAWRVGALFNIEPGQVETAQYVLLLIGGYLSIRFPFAIFGAVVYGFQRYYLNNVVSIATSVIVAGVTVAVLGTGHGLVTLAIATTVVRLASLFFFAWNAYRTFPGLHVRPSLFRRERLKEVTGFSVYMIILDWSAKLNYSADALVIGSMLNTAAVAVWAVAQRLTEVAQKLTGQLNDALFPNVVDSDAAQREDRLQRILVQGSKLSLVLAAPLCLGLIILADPLIHAWVGPQFAGSVLPTQILLSIVLIRVSTAPGNLILKGAGQHRLLAFTNAGTAIVNVLLSVALIGPLGLLGVALGTLIPVTLATVFIIYPAACRRVGLPLKRPLLEAFWPAGWPAVFMAAVFWAGRNLGPTNLFAIAGIMTAGGLVYVLLFVGFAIPIEERRFYWNKLRAFIAATSGSMRPAPAKGAPV